MYYVSVCVCSLTSLIGGHACVSVCVGVGVGVGVSVDTIVIHRILYSSN